MTARIYKNYLPDLANQALKMQCSYSTNEAAINCNAPLAFLAGAVQSEYLNNFTDSMPKCFIISSTKVDLPYKKGDGVQIVIEGNTNWNFSPSAGWIEVDIAGGTGSGTVLVNSTSDNPDDLTRSGKIYVYSGGVLSDSIMVTRNGVRKSFRIEAEDYDGMPGLQTESTSDFGGGKTLVMLMLTTG